MTGFESKRAAAADKLQEPVCDKDPQGCWNVRCQLGKQCKNLAQPVQPQQDESDLLTIAYQSGFYDGKKAALAQSAQEPVACVMGTYGGMFVVGPLNSAVVLPVGMALYATPQHTATWVGLTDEEREDIALEVPMDAVFITEAKLKEKNG